MKAQTKTAKYRAIFDELKEDRRSYLPHWREIADVMLPRKGLYLEGESQNARVARAGDKFHQKIINGSASDALRVISAGMQGGLTSPSRPWFVLGLPDEDLMEFGPVKAWLHDTRNKMLVKFARSNFYSSTHGLYKELAAFGTSAMLFEEDTKTIFRCRPFTVGEYTIALDAAYRPCALYRQVALTVRQLVQAYGLENCSQAVQDAYKSDKLSARFEIIHLIEKNSDLNPAKADYRGMEYLSVAFELNGDQDKILKIGGYRTIPFVAPRWDVSGINAYGDSPGMDSLGDIKMLQKMEEKKLKLLDKQVDPPMNAPASMKQAGGTIVPGGINFIDIGAGNQSFTPAYQVNPNYQSISFEIERVEQRIKRFFYNDMFLSIIANDKTQTAYEVSKRWEEKLMMLGPTIERLQSEKFDIEIERVFDMMNRAGEFTPPPKEIEGMDIKVEYISLLAQAQKMVGTTSIEQTAAFVGRIASAAPEVMDKLDAEETVDQYAELVGAPPKMIRTDDQVAELRAKRAQAQQAQALLAAGESAASTGKTLAETKVGTNSALDALTGNLGG